MGVETLLIGSMVAGAATSLIGASNNSDAVYAEAANKQHAAEMERIFTVYQLEIQEGQLKEELAEIKLNAGQKVIARQRQAEAVHQANVAFVVGSGVGENMSFTQGIDKANQRTEREDLRAI